MGPSSTPGYVIFEHLGLVSLPPVIALDWLGASGSESTPECSLQKMVVVQGAERTRAQQREAER